MDCNFVGIKSKEKEVRSFSKAVSELKNALVVAGITCEDLFKLCDRKYNKVIRINDLFVKAKFLNIKLSLSVIQMIRDELNS
jgi:hypothetical protein